MTHTEKGYLVRHLRDAAVTPCPCGTSHRIFTGADAPTASVHVTEITDSARHYHKVSTEYYYVLAGTGQMELNDEVVALEPGLAILIEPGTRHRVSGDIQALILVVPALQDADEYLE